MSIKKIIIKNFRSIESMELDFTKEKNITCFLGKNGVGKSNIFLALKYFYDNLDELHVEEIIDKHNPYNTYCEISIIYDLQEFEVKISTSYLRDFFVSLCEQAKECKLSVFSLINVKKNLIKVTLRQDKDGQIKWNQSKEVRKRIKKLFPFYHINTRNLDLLTWERIWETIGDLAADVPVIDEENINKKLDSIFSDIYSKYDGSKRIVEKAFSDNNISLDKYHFQSRFKYMFMTRFNGEIFINEGHSLDYYSDGLNSFTYIKILVTLISNIADISCKSPIIVLDEPEMGLHNTKIEELVQSLISSMRKYSFLLISTHSPRLICDLITNEEDVDIYHLYLKNWYTKCKKLNTDFLTKQKHHITTNETECYFSEMIVFVEGESDFQLFNDPYLKKIFPFLKRIHFYPFDNNSQRLNYVYPKSVNIGIPYVILLDIDKVVQFNDVNGNYKKAKLNSDLINPLSRARIKKDFKYSYFNNTNTNNKSRLYHEIQYIIKNNTFNYRQNNNYVEIKEYFQLIRIIRQLCKFYNCLVNETTIEGELVNENNVDIFLKFCRDRSHKESLVESLCNISDISEKTALTRLAIDGRLDLGEDTIISNSLQIHITNLFDSKTDGWINDWMCYFYCNMLSDVDNKVERFGDFFPSLCDSLQYLDNMLKYCGE